MKIVLPLLIALAPGFASAQSLGAGNPTGLVSAMQDEGYRAVLETDGEGDPKIVSSTGGTNFSIYFYGCESNRNCTDLQFSVGFDKANPLSALAMNEWNRLKLYGKAYIDDEGDPHMQMFVPGAEQIPVASFNRTLRRWEGVLGDFKEHIDWDS